MFPIKFSTQLQFLFTLFILINFRKLAHSADSNETKPRSVFPLDVVTFRCKKASTSTPDPSQKTFPKFDECVWNFYEKEAPSANDTKKQVKTACIKTKNNSTRDNEGSYIGYLEVPETARSIWCIGDDEPTPLLLQNAKIAEPLSRFDNPTPQIILQRYSDDFAVRFGVHDVTNETIFLDGQEVSAIKLYCVHTVPVAWANYTDYVQRLMKFLKERDLRWLESLSINTNLEKNWELYLDYLQLIEKELVHADTKRFAREQTIYKTPLVIRKLAKQSGRKYECRSMLNETVFVNLEVQYPRSITPDEIHLIQQIIEILDSLAQGKGKGPYYTLGSFLSIFLILFGYYCKKKLEEPSTEAPKPVPTNPPANEEAEQRVQLRNVASSPKLLELVEKRDDENKAATTSTILNENASVLKEVTVNKDS